MPVSEPNSDKDHNDVLKRLNDAEKYFAVSCVLATKPLGVR